jgi:hypothetical protein
VLLASDWKALDRQYFRGPSRIEQALRHEPLGPSSRSLCESLDDPAEDTLL